MKMPFLIFTLVFGTAYVAVEKAGLFSGAPRSCLHILYSWPILADSFLILCFVSGAAFISRRAMGRYHWAGVVSCILIVSGLWLGSFTRFSAEVILTEGQDFYSGHGNYAPGSLYRGRFAAVPDIALKMEEIIPSFSSSGMDIEHLKGRLTVFQKDNAGTSELILTDGMPKMLNGTILKIKGLGYSPRYELRSETGKLLDSAFVYMRLFPPGNESFFRLLSPITYHVRYYPEGKDGIMEPLLRVRIVRNKDIVVNRDVKISEDISFENSRISFEEVRMWTKLVIKKDRGEVMVLAGLLLGALYLLMTLKRYFRGTH